VPDDALWPQRPRLSVASPSDLSEALRYLVRFPPVSPVKLYSNMPSNTTNQQD